MFKINADKSIFVTRGDAVTISIAASDGESPYTFVVGDIVRLKVFEKKACHCVVLQKDVQVAKASETVDIALSGGDTKFGELISKPTDYWYEVELNPDSQPQTIVGYDEDGAKVFRLYPEGGDKE